MSRHCERGEVIPGRSWSVITSVAWQSRCVHWLHASGLPRRCAPRSDGGEEEGGLGVAVIASGVKRAGLSLRAKRGNPGVPAGSILLDCRVAALLAVTEVGGRRFTVHGLRFGVCGLGFTAQGHRG